MIPTIIIGTIVLILMALAVVKSRKDSKKGGCGCGCEGCPNSSQCHPDK